MKAVSYTHLDVYKRQKMAHALLVEIFSIIGVGTVIMPDKEHYYPHELKKRAAAAK